MHLFFGKKYLLGVLFILFTLTLFYQKSHRPSSVIASTLRISQGPIVGAVTSESAVIWFRTTTPENVKILYSTLPNLNGASTSAAINTQAGNDYTGKITLSELRSNTLYYYNLIVNNRPQFANNFPGFKTFPVDSQSTDFKIVVLTDFCCFGAFTPPVSQTFTNASNENPNLVLIGGDFDHRNPTGISIVASTRQKRKMFKDLYTPANNMQGFVNKILRKYPVAHVWDDHDFGKNNSDKTYPYKALSLQILNDFFPTYPMTQLGDWQKFRIGQVEIFMLDSRSQRDPNKDTDGPNKSMLDGNNLGANGQLEWLKAGLQNSTATWKVIFTPSVFNPTSGKADTWYSYKNERKVLLDFIKNNNTKNVFSITGDVHAGGIDNGTNAGIPEMMVTTANLSGCLTANFIGNWSEGTYKGGSCMGYGVAEFLTNPDRVVLRVKDSSGSEKINYTLNSQ